MLVFLVWTQRMKRLNGQYSDDSAENIRLLKVNIDEFGSSILNVVYSLANMRDLEFRRE